MTAPWTQKDVEFVRRDLERVIDGNVMGAEAPAYTSAVTVDNGRIRRPPYVVVSPQHTRDIAKTVKYCAQYDIRLTTKSGGHGAAGYCLNAEGLVLDMSSLTSIRPHDGGARVATGMGVRWQQLYDYVQQNEPDYIAVGGGCGNVGLGGFLLGGGFSFVSRSYGLGCDNVTAMEFVSADGDIYRLGAHPNNGHERDLYWALRGAGGGNFGIVSQVDLDLHKRPSTNMMMGALTFAFERAEELLQFYNAWILTLPKQMAVYGMLRRFTVPGHGSEPILCLRFSPIYNGLFSEGMALLKPLVDRSPMAIELYALTLPQWESFVGNGTMIGGRSAYMRSAIIAPNRLDAAAAEILVRHMREAPSNDSYVVWTHIGGSVRDKDKAEASCFAHRDAEFVFELKSIWAANDKKDTRRNVEWAVRFVDEFETHAQGAYLNYIDPLLVQWQQKYYRGSYDRLLRVREHWDPKGRFVFQQGIGSNFHPTRTVPLDLSPLGRTYRPSQ